MPASWPHSCSWYGSLKPSGFSEGKRQESGTHSGSVSQPRSWTVRRHIALTHKVAVKVYHLWGHDKKPSLPCNPVYSLHLWPYFLAAVPQHVPDGNRKTPCPAWCCCLASTDWNVSFWWDYGQRIQDFVHGGVFWPSCFLIWHNYDKL